MVPGSDVSAAPLRVSVRQWSVAGLGAGLLGVTLSYFVVGDDLLSVVFVRFSIPVALSLLVVALGVWLWTEEVPTDLTDVVFMWSLAGGVVMGLLAGWISLIQSAQGRPLLQPASIVLTKVTVGTLGGGLLGVYYSRLQQRTEQLAEQRNRLDEFASIVSHDLRNPLNVAQGHLELAHETGEAHHFEAAEGAHDRMERLVDEVLALSRRGDTVDDPESVDLATVARDAWATVETAGVDLEVETDRTVVSDGRRLRALFENLFRNAVEHGSTGNPPLADDARRTSSDVAHQNPTDSEDAAEHGSTSHRPEDDDAAEHGTANDQQRVVNVAASGDDTVTVGDTSEGFYVADDGPGIPPEDRERVFEGGYSTAVDGTGFGLAIVRRIAEAHGWTVSVAESDDGGARFEFAGLDGKRT